MADIFGGIAAVVELTIQLMMLLVRLLYWSVCRLLGREVEPPRRPAKSPAPPAWALASVGIVLGGLAVAASWYYFRVERPRQKTRKMVAAQADSWKARIKSDGLESWEPRTLEQCDMWGNPLQVRFTDGLVFATLSVGSAGPDGVRDTGDDITSLRLLEGVDFSISSDPPHDGEDPSWQRRAAGWAAEFLAGDDDSPGEE